jgi:multidrug efflux pump subunit AcrB
MSQGCCAPTSVLPLGGSRTDLGEDELAPGANALSTLGAVKQGMAAAEKDFPDDLAWKVTYDPTTFVTDTMHEVQKTLVEAFILVVLVVYLFLGSFRATLIPTIAVPVSLIGHSSC